MDDIPIYSLNTAYWGSAVHHLQDIFFQLYVMYVLVKQWKTRTVFLFFNMAITDLMSGICAYHLGHILLHQGYNNISLSWLLCLWCVYNHIISTQCSGSCIGHFCGVLWENQHNKWGLKLKVYNAARHQHYFNHFKKLIHASKYNNILILEQQIDLLAGEGAFLSKWGHDCYGASRVHCCNPKIALLNAMLMLDQWFHFRNCHISTFNKTQICAHFCILAKQY